MLKPWIMPRLVSQSKDGVNTAVVKTQRKNRFNATFELGSMASCAADAATLVDDAAADLVARIRMNWLQGKDADGITFKHRDDYQCVEDIPRAFSLAEYAKYENQVLDGTFQIQRKSKKKNNSKQIDAWKAWAKFVRKNYTYNGKVYHPSEKKNVGNWSGLMADSLHAEPVRIRSRNGKIPTKVTVRITVAPQRGEAVDKLQALRMDSRSEAFRNIQKHTEWMAKQTTVFRSYEERASWTAQDLVRLYNRYRAIRNVLVKVSRVVA